MTAPGPRDVPLVSPANRRLGVEVEDLPDGAVRLTLTTDDTCHNELGMVHGGLTAFLLDGAMGRAAGRSLAPGETCATLQLSLQYLAPATGRIRAVGRIVRRGRTVAFLEGTCTREDGTEIARANGVWSVRAAR
jgi:uncharacterized protein (TIGR00369 family)